MARDGGISGWHSMRKEELVRALLEASKRRTKSPSTAHKVVDQTRSVRSANGSRTAASRHALAASGGGTSPHVSRRIHQLHAKLATIKNLASKAVADEPSRNAARRDRLVVMVRDPYWLHAYWELTQTSVDRAQAAMAQRWHGARPVLRLFRLDEDGAAAHQRDIEIHGGVSNWYVDVPDPPSHYRLEIGYLSRDGFFYPLARSNDVMTPPAGTSDAVDENWTDVAEQADRIFAMSGGYSARGASRELQELLEERLRRPLGTPMKTRFGSGAAAPQHQLQFAVDAEIIVYGAADRDAHVTLEGEPVQLRDDGTFAVRLSLPDRRQVIPVVASSYDGLEQRTIIIAVERNTKIMEPVIRDVAGG
jgi:hypothetical protein